MTTKTELSVTDALEFQGYSAYLDGYLAGAAALVEHLKRNKVEELARKAQAKAAQPPKQEAPVEPEAYVNGAAHAS